jgi:hypothetical protein
VAKQFEGKKLGGLVDEAAALLISVGEEKDFPKLETFVLKEVDPVRGLLAFLLFMELSGESLGDPQILKKAPPARRALLARGTALVGQWMVARTNAAMADAEQRMRGIPLRFFELKRGRESRRIEGRLTEATMEALRVVNGLCGVLEALGDASLKSAVTVLRGGGKAAPSWPPTGDLSGGVVQRFVQLKSAMVANPELFWLFGGALDDVLDATNARHDAETYTIPITWGPTAT